MIEVRCCVVMMKGKLVSFEHSINFNRVQVVSIRRYFQYKTDKALYQFCIAAEKDLRIETTCTLVKLMLCSKLTNLPFMIIIEMMWWRLMLQC